MLLMSNKLLAALASSFKDRRSRKRRTGISSKCGYGNKACVDNKPDRQDKPGPPPPRFRRINRPGVETMGAAIYGQDGRLRGNQTHDAGCQAFISPLSSLPLSLASELVVRVCPSGPSSPSGPSVRVSRHPAHAMFSGSAATDHWFLTTGNSRPRLAMCCALSVFSVFSVSVRVAPILPFPCFSAEILQVFTDYQL